MLNSGVVRSLSVHYLPPTVKCDCTGSRMQCQTLLLVCLGSYLWEKTFPYCTGDFALSQSPVNLNPNYMVRNMSMEPLVLEGYNVTQANQWSVMNIRDTGKYVICNKLEFHSFIYSFNEFLVGVDVWCHAIGHAKYLVKKN